MKEKGRDGIGVQHGLTCCLPMMSAVLGEVGKLVFARSRQMLQRLMRDVETGR